MVTVKARDNEAFESLLKRFKKAVEKSGLLTDSRKHEFYEKPSIRMKRKQAAARKREAKRKSKLERQRNRAGRKTVDFTWNKDKTKKIPMSKRPKYNSNRRSANPKTQKR